MLIYVSLRRWNNSLLPLVSQVDTPLKQTLKASRLFIDIHGFASSSSSSNPFPRPLTNPPETFARSTQHSTEGIFNQGQDK